MLTTGDTVYSPRSLEIARQAAGGLMNAVDGVMTGKLDRAFCAVRPPGHHATKHLGMGFCIFNNAAIAARYAQMLITVGTEARWIAAEAGTHGLPGHRIRSFDTAEEAALFLKDIISRDDALLVKGSRHGIRLERAVKILMQDPDRADELLV